MKKNTLLTIGGSLILSASLTGAAFGQDSTMKTTTTVTKTAVVENADGSYSVIEYPVDKEVVVDLMPNGTAGAMTRTARVLRTADGTTVNFDMKGSDMAGDYYAYAVDPTGAVTYLGAVSGAGSATPTAFKTSLNQFMLVLSPNQGLTTIDKSTPILYRSAVPKGYAVVGNRTTSVTGDEKQMATTQAVASAYEVPLLGVSGFEKGETEIRINFSGELQGLKGKAYLDNSKVGLTKVKMRFDDMKLAPKQKRYVLWTVSPDNKYTKIGQVINNGNRAEAEIRGETALKDFGLFVTLEEKDVAAPTGRTYSSFSIGK